MKTNSISPLKNQSFQKITIDKYNSKKNSELHSRLTTMNFKEVDSLYSLFNNCKTNLKDKSLLQIINHKMEIEKYNIKGILKKYCINLSSINKYTFEFLGEYKYNIKFVLYKILKKQNNKLLSKDTSKYIITLLNVSEETKNSLEKKLKNFYLPVFIFTNLEGKLELEESGKHIINFQSSINSKIYFEVNKTDNPAQARKHFQSSGIYLDFFQNNEFSFIKTINSQKFLEEKLTKFHKINKNLINSIIIDLKPFLEVNTESLYIENLSEEFNHIYPLKETINLCCIVKEISNKDNDSACASKKFVYVTLENIFDLNNLILEIPKDNELLENMKINCIYLFMNMTVFIDEKLNIKLTVQKYNKTSYKICLYYLLDYEKLLNKKINDLLDINKYPYSQLITLTSENKLVRYLQKYYINVDKIVYLNLSYKDKDNFYEGYLFGSDGTSSGYFHIKGNNISELKKLNVNLDDKYIKTQLMIDQKMTIYPNVEEKQVIIIGVPMMKKIQETPLLDVYENINDLNNRNNINEEAKNIKIKEFDISLTKNEFTLINGAFLKKSKILEVIPVIKIYKIFSVEDLMSFRNIETQYENNKI